ncbi:MAG: VCBS repeat-containing protein [Actinobacteria bacterium]|nr:VCBS repeat-containing protein [Actinomycetota bacterium]
MARGDLDNDGHDELIVAPGPGIEPGIRVFKGNGNGEIANINAYPGFKCGVYVAAGDVDGDGKDAPMLRRRAGLRGARPGNG